MNTNQITIAQANAARMTAIGQFNSTIKELSAALKSLENVLIGEGYIVMCGKMGITFTVDAQRNVTNPRVSRVDTVLRMTQQDAERVARTVKNGAGDVGVAVHVVDAIRAQIKETEAVRNQIASLIEEE